MPPANSSWPYMAAQTTFRRCHPSAWHQIADPKLTLVRHLNSYQLHVIKCQLWPGSNSIKVPRRPPARAPPSTQ
eukprot:scaffold4036_cov115-Isochrysis_galbana.AAC.4